MACRFASQFSGQFRDNLHVLLALIHAALHMGDMSETQTKTAASEENRRLFEG
jgi:hypothetical protein